MPLGIERLNARQQGPNKQIVFIKALAGPDHATAVDFLNRVAAICVPVMKANHLGVLTLEEHEANYEFVGRNFNAGEVIQLVLKSPRTGRWLPFRYVQMVMMHELAHCKEMNHSRAFWKVRNQYAGELKGLWDRNYTGDGLWGRGQSLYTGQYTEDALPATDELPQHLCGGTYRTSRRGKRKRRGASERPVVSYAERKQRRILKRFGTGGVSLGDDERSRMSLESCSHLKGKPKVAGSKRGRELRAAAALARFDDRASSLSREEDDESETDSEYEPINDGNDALDSKGNRLIDSKGRGMVKVCEDNDAVNDTDARNELQELHGTLDRFVIKTKPRAPLEVVDTNGTDEDDISTASESDAEYGNVRLLSRTLPPTRGSAPAHRSMAMQEPAVRDSSDHTVAVDETSKRRPQSSGNTVPQARFDDAATRTVAEDATKQHSISCPICTASNAFDALTCIVCAHVLDAQKLPSHWQCVAEECKDGMYINSGDCHVCGVCGSSRA